MVNIFIANLDWSITSDDLQATFSSFGTVTYAHVVYERETKRSKGFGYVEMESTEEAIRAIEALNGLEVNLWEFKWNHSFQTILKSAIILIKHKKDMK